MKGTGRDQYIQDYVTSLHLPAGTNNAPYVAEAGASYDRLEKECSSICDGYNSGANMREIMLADMMPPSGQYARPSDHNNDPTYDANNPDTWPPSYGIFTSLDYQQASYYDVNGGQQTIDYNGTATPPSSLPETTFIENFEPQWAESLLPFHPEYQKLLKYESYKPSHLWDETFEQTATYQEAVTNGLLTPLGGLSGYTPYMQTGNVTDPFFLSQTFPYTGEPGLLAAFKDKLTHYQVYNQIDLSLWQFVNLSVKCIRANISVSQQCFNASTDITHVFDPSVMCDSDLQMAWIMFRNLYLQEKRIFQNEYLNQIIPSPFQNQLYHDF